MRAADPTWLPEAGGVIDLAPAVRRVPRAACRSAALACAAAMLSACALAPPDHPPAPPAPAHYGTVPTPPASVAADGVAQRFALGARPVPDWWRLYGSATLSSWVAEGLAHSPSLSAAEHTLAAAREQLRAQVGESRWPTLDAGGQVARQRALGTPVFGPQTILYNVFVGQLNASYTIDLFGAARYANASLAARVDQQSFQFDAARRALAADIVVAALNAAALRAQFDASTQLVQAATDQARDMQARYRSGSAARTDALTAQQSAQSLAAALPALRQQWLAARHVLAVLLGRTPDQAPPELDLAQVRLPDPVPVSVPSDLLRQRPDILAAQALVQATAAQVGVATAQMFPSLSLSASMGQGGFDWTTATGAAGALWSAGASLSAPLFHGGALRARRRAAQQDYQAALEQYRQTVLAAFENVADTLAALDNDARALAAAGAARASAQELMQASAARYRLGAVPRSATWEAQQQYQNARLAEIRALGARLTDSAKLFQAMGVPQPAVPAKLARGAAR